MLKEFIAAAYEDRPMAVVLAAICLAWVALGALVWTGQALGGVLGDLAAEQYRARN